ncbi:heterokaryon incompatibility protein-domain-containing protein [Stachybotrys elegans]|uniref:Heterokaryon incompatibility protein-domain-containing protein n=1 Tax=Stachybotrys elegans TaxID=80388 RepID=A0A8K0SYK9_9HYPO|nr:heterokaryon incompatibility protein-domain-containing protein [Stachybotrys elegans]
MRRLLKRLAHASDRLGGDESGHQPASSSSPSHSAVANAPFEYRPISQSHFRILRLRRPLHGSDGAYDRLPLHGTLIEAPLANPPKYQALFYTWGDPSLCEAINLDGRILRITANCAAALRRMLRGKLERLIWVDSICINQANTPAALAERGHQVALMDVIYSGAEQVNVHLGEGDAASDAACEALRSLTAPYLGAKLPGPQQEMCRRKYESLADEITRITPEYPYGKLYGVFRLPWFKRTWVVQEVALGRKVMFYCGTYLLALDTMVIGSDFTRLPYSRAHEPASFHWKAYLGYHDAMREFIRRKAQGEALSEMTLDSVLLMPAVKLEATRPEDKIFGLYGVCKQFGFQLPPPDYTKPLAVVYAEAARAMMDSSRSLDFLTSVNESAAWNEYGLPSWVPNFAGSMQQWSPSSPPHIAVGMGGDSRISGGSKYEYSLEAGGMRLRVKGRRLGFVVAMGLPWMTDASTTLLGESLTQTGQFIDALLDSLGGWYQVSRDAFPRDEALAMQAMVRTLLLARNASKSLVTSFLPFDTMVHYLSILVSVSQSGQHRRADTTVPLVSPHDNSFAGAITIGNYFLTPTMHQVMQQIFNAGWRTVFRMIGGPSETGEHLGLGTHSIRAEDMVVVFAGSSAAAIVRPWQDGFRYVGPAAVDGVMDGEFWNMASEGHDEWFTLI